MILERIRCMMVKEFIHLFRDPKMRGVVFLLPLIQVLVFGYAVTTDVKHIPTAVLDLDRSAASRGLIARFERSGYFTLVAFLDREDQTQSVLDRDQARAVLQISPGFENDLLAGRPAPLQVLLDGTDSNTARHVLDYSARIIDELAAALRAERAGQPSVAPPRASLDLQTRAWFNDNLESRNFYVPGVIAILVMLITLMLTSMAVVREKEIGTMEQILVTPITPGEFILGKTLPFILIGFLDVLAITAVGVLWFDVPIRGSLALLLLSTALYLMTTLGVGLLISTVSETQQQAMMSTFFFYFPAVLLSGFMFPIANMPPLVQALTWVNPLRYFLVILRGIFLKGVGVSILWPQMLALALIGSLTLWAATRRFHKTMA